MLLDSPPKEDAPVDVDFSVTAAELDSDSEPTATADRVAETLPPDASAPSTDDAIADPAGKLVAVALVDSEPSVLALDAD
jgi:hypothetical protein